MTTYAKRAKPFLGTYVEIGLVTEDALHPAFKAAFEVIAAIQTQMSFHHPGSALSRLNQNPQTWVQLPEHTLQVLRLAKKLGEQSQDLFNCTVGGQLVQNGVLPNPVQHPFLTQGCSADLEINEDAARLNQPLLITLDGIAKGYAVDQAISVLQGFDLAGGWVNAGGDIRVFGKLDLPIQLRSALDLNPIVLNNQAIASSQVGIAPSEAFPSQMIGQNLTRPGQISVLATHAWLADGLTKVLGQGCDAQRQRLAQQFNVQFIWQDAL